MKWGEKEIEYLKHNYKINPNLSNISKNLKRSTRSIQHKGLRLGLFRPRFKKKYSDAQPKKAIDKRYYGKNKKEVYRRKQERVRKIITELKMMLGGKCKTCGYKKSFYALDFHHLGEKEDVVSKIARNFSKDKALKEARKCILLCANCHRELHHADP